MYTWIAISSTMEIFIPDDLIMDIYNPDIFMPWPRMAGPQPADFFFSRANWISASSDFFCSDRSPSNYHRVVLQRRSTLLMFGATWTFHVIIESPWGKDVPMPNFAH